MDAAMIICNCPKCEKKREEMSKRYIVVEERKAYRNFSLFFVYKKGWFFNEYVKMFGTKEEAISFVLKLIEHGPNKDQKKIVFDTEKDLSFDIHF